MAIVYRSFAYAAMLLICAETSAFHIGPALSTRVATTATSLAQPVQMAGFGGATGAAKGKKKGGAKTKGAAVKKAPLSMKRQWDRHQQLVGSGQPRNAVFARIQGDEESGWVEVGDVATAPGTDLAGAVQLHKRLILEHAARVSPKLSLKAKSLECGFAAAGGDGDSPAVLAKVEAVDAAAAGFEGLPDPSGRYSAMSNMDGVKKMGVGQEQEMGGY